MRTTKWHIGDRVQLTDKSVQGVITAINHMGHLEIHWDDGERSPAGSVHKDDVHPVHGRKEQKP